MSAQSIYDYAPIGSLVAWSDGSPRPPDRFTKKLSAWQTNNGKGRLIRRQSERRVGDGASSASFTLHEADYGAGGVFAIRVHRTFSSDSRLDFIIVERPAIGAVRVFDRAGDNAELVYLAAHAADAQEWLTRHGYPQAVLEEVTADEVGTKFIDGRAA